MAQVDIDSTIAALQQGLTAIPTDQAIAAIESWQQQLQGNDLAEDLGELKTALTSGTTSKGMSLAEILGLAKPLRSAVGDRKSMSERG